MRYSYGSFSRYSRIESAWSICDAVRSAFGNRQSRNPNEGSASSRQALSRLTSESLWQEERSAPPAW